MKSLMKLVLVDLDLTDWIVFFFTWIVGKKILIFTEKTVVMLQEIPSDLVGSQFNSAFK